MFCEDTVSGKTAEGSSVLPQLLLYRRHPLENLSVVSNVLHYLEF